MEMSTVKLVSQTPMLATLPKEPLPEAMDSGESGRGVVLDQEKKIRREIANSNERRRMQSINAGFQSLRTLLPHHEGEKLSKAAILQQTAEYIYSLEQEKTRLLAQNCHLKRLLSLSQQHLDENPNGLSESKRKRIKSEVKDVMETRIEGHTELLPPKIELIKEPDALALAKSANTTKTNPVTPQQVVPTAVVSQPTTAQIVKTATLVEPKKPLSQPTIPPTVTLPAAMKSAEPCRIILSDNRIGPDTLVVPIQPPGQQQKQKTVTPATLVCGEKVEKVQDASSGRSYIVTGSSKQNLDSIVEAIKHLEGDHLFSSEEVKVPSEVAKEEIVEYSLSDTNPSTHCPVIPPTASTQVISSTGAALQIPGNVSATTISLQPQQSKESYIIFKN